MALQNHSSNVKSYQVICNKMKGSEAMKSCIQHPKRPPSPEKQCIMHKWNQTKLADHRIFWATVKDSQPEFARALNHGARPEQGVSMKDCIAPEDLSPLKQRITSENEKIYETNKRKPLGTSPKPNLPSHIDPNKTIFGKPLVKDGVANLLNPDIRRIEILKQELEDRMHYLRPYARLLPGEQAERGYNSHFREDKRFGVVTCSDKEGSCVHQLMNWVNDKTEMTVDSGCLNKVKNVMATNHAFGKPSMIGKRNVAELMHGFTPKNILGLTAPYSTPFHNNRNAGNHCVDLAEQERIVRALVKKQLRDKRYNRGPDLAAVLCDLANGEQYITEAVAQEVYEAFEPPLDNELRELLFDIIREDNGRNAVNKKLSETVEFREDGTNDPKIINWRLMAKILDFNRFQPWERPFGHGYIDETQCVQQSSECAEKTRLRIANAIKARSKVPSTTNQAYQGNRNGLINSSLWQPLGFSTRNCEPIDLLYKNRRHGETCVPTAQSSVCTPFLGRYDSCKRRMFVLRTKEEIEKILEETGLKGEMKGDCSIEKIWSLAKQFSRTDPVINTISCGDAERVTLESVKQALNQCTREQIEAKISEKYKNCCISTSVAVNKGLLI